MSPLPIDEHSLQHVHRHRELIPHESTKFSRVDTHELRRPARPHGKVVTLGRLIEKRRNRSAVATAIGRANRLDISAAGSFGHHQLPIDQHKERLRRLTLMEQGVGFVLCELCMAA